MRHVFAISFVALAAMAGPSLHAGAAKAADFLALMRTVRAEVKARQGVELQPEIVALGREWKELL